MVAVLLTAATSCSPFRRSVPVNVMELGPAGTLRRASEAAGESLPMRVTATLQLRFEGGSMTGQGAVLYAEPDSVRLDITAFLGSTVLQALITNGNTRVYAPSDDVVLEGELEPGMLVYVAGYPFDLASVREWILGPAITIDWPPLLDGIDRFDVGVNDVIISTVAPDGRRITAKLDTELRFRSVIQMDARGRVLWETSYDNYDRVRGNYYPDRITLRYPVSGMELSINVNRRTVNPRREAGDFLLPVPAGTRRVQLRPITPPPEKP